jgi:succinoglycan biosynthesis protein ExoM
VTASAEPVQAEPVKHTLGAPERAPKVWVAVLTYRRPADLEAILPLLVAQAATVDPDCQVLVVDNDPAGGAREVVEAHAGVTYVHEATPGIAAARNRALEVARASSVDVLVFIDDDERPSESWLRLLVDRYLVDRPFAVVGPVVSEFTAPLEPWVEAGRFFDRRRLPTGTPVTLAATNNLLLDLDQVDALGLRFDDRYGVTGGSDTLFTRAAAAAGARLVWCDEAVVTDVVPVDRLTRRWVLRRAFRAGNTWTRTSLDLAPSRPATVAVALKMAVLGAVRTAAGGVRWLAGIVSRSARHQARGARTAARGAGVLAGLVGGRLVEYRRPVG